MGNGGSIEQRADYLVVDCSAGAGAHEIAQLYRDFAVECVTHQRNRVLLKALDCSAEGHRALRDAFTTMVLAGIPGGLRLALVSNVAGIRAQFFDLQRDLWRLNIHAALFDDEPDAARWLAAKGEPPTVARQGATSSRA